MNDPTNWNAVAYDPTAGTFESPELAREVAKRWNAYEGLVAFVAKACDYGVSREEALLILRDLEVESAMTHF